MPCTYCSALEGTGLEEIWKVISNRTAEQKQRGYLKNRRSEQDVNWMWSLVDQQIRDMLHQHPTVSTMADCVAAQVRAGTLSPVMASEQVVSALFSGAVSALSPPPRTEICAK
jgi:LAO/AO transport system kinase